MVMSSYYNLGLYPTKSHPPNLTYAASQWYAGNYHHPPNQFLSESDAPAQTMYYPHMFNSSPDGWNHAHDNYGGAPQTALLQSGGHGGPGNGHINSQTGNGNERQIIEGISSLPSPPITVSGSEMSSPGAPNGSASPQNAARPAPAKSPYEWMKKTSYTTQPNPGKTRTKDKYRVVYSDHQRLELEKEYHTSRYITIRRKTELAQVLALSERQVKIWFQNRRAKERKLSKKQIDTTPSSQHPSLLDVKPKLEPNFHPALHQMSAMSMGMTSMGHIHHHHHALSSHLSVPTSQHLHQPSSQQITPGTPI